MLTLCIPVGQDQQAVLPEDIGNAIVTLGYDVEPFRSGDWRKRVADIRNRLLETVTTRYWMTFDTDTVIPEGVIPELLGWMEEHPDWGGVGVQCLPPNRGGSKRGTVHLGCAMFRSEATENLLFRTEGQHGKACECLYCWDDLTGAGWVYQYHPVLEVEHP
jgi:hypothetical protein